jgi:hypothetical protein
VEKCGKMSSRMDTLQYLECPVFNENYKPCETGKKCPILEKKAFN